MTVSGEEWVGDLRKILARWQRADYVLLHCGEMKAQELRSVQAALKAMKLEIEAYMPPGTFGEDGR